MKLRNGKVLSFEDGSDERIPARFPLSVGHACKAWLEDRGQKTNHSRLQFGKGIRRMGKAAAVVAVVAVAAVTSGCAQDRMAHYAEFSTISNAESGVDGHARHPWRADQQQRQTASADYPGNVAITGSRNQPALCTLSPDFATPNPFIP